MSAAVSGEILSAGNDAGNSQFSCSECLSHEILNVSSCGVADASNNFNLSPNVPLIYIHISLISNDGLKTHLGLNVMGSCVDRCDWLDEFASSPYNGDESSGPEDVFQARYNLNIGRLVDKASSLGGGNHRKQKSRKK
ncbi:hypothetical protein M5K25_018627 [Dendrobium thyrsiflorum]|uniref:Uncharacterized protein n=1 Tax=Dendrobium thyrsiflorum TaxID=117978 RepID=A0ABD0UJ31_DENTH